MRWAGNVAQNAV